MIEVREALFEDAFFVASRLRESDKRELLAASPDDPERRVLDSWRVSDWSRVALVDGEPAVLWGVAQCIQMGEQYGSPWLLATEKITKIRRGFVEKCLEDKDLVMNSYPKLFNLVHRENLLSQSWLQWMGFVLHKEPTGNNGQFYLFTSQGFFDV